MKRDGDEEGRRGCKGGRSGSKDGKRRQKKAKQGKGREGKREENGEMIRINMDTGKARNGGTVHGEKE